MLEMFHYDFMIRALVVGIFLALSASLVGVSIVLRGRSMLGDGLSHAAFGAVAIATVLGLSPLPLAIPVVIALSFFLLKSSHCQTMNNDAKIALLSTTSLALGTFLISIVKGVNIDLNSYLFGSILSLEPADVILTIILSIIITILYIVEYNRIFALDFDETFARAIGIRTNYYNALFAGLCSVVVVLGLRLMGSLLVGALLIFPPLCARLLVQKFSHVVVASVIIAVFSFILGLILSYLFSTPTGATVVLVNFVIFLICSLVDLLVKNKQ